MLYYTSILLIVSSNVFYHLASKKVPQNSNPFFFVMMSYLVGFVFALIAFSITKGNKGLVTAFSEQTKIINWTPIVLGISVIGLEVGNVLMYRAGWDISKGSLVSNILLATVLLIIGVIFYKDNFGIQQIAGLICCIAGMFLLN